MAVTSRFANPPEARELPWTWATETRTETTPHGRLFDSTHRLRYQARLKRPPGRRRRSSACSRPPATTRAPAALQLV